MTIKMGRDPKPHKVPRIPIQMQKPWADLARKLAAKNKQPMLWLLLSLLADEADKQDMEHPPLPWEEQPDEE